MAGRPKTAARGLTLSKLSSGEIEFRALISVARMVMGRPKTGGKTGGRGLAFSKLSSGEIEFSAFNSVARIVTGRANIGAGEGVSCMKRSTTFKDFTAVVGR
jgi:hypothetical protein